MIRVTYKKKNGDILQRTITTYSPYRVGDVTSMGWLVEDIKYKYKDKWYSKRDYDRLIDKAIDKQRRYIKIRKTISNIYRNLGYFVELMIVLKVFQVLTNVSA